MIKREKKGFWKYLNNEVQSSVTDGAGLIIQMDGNLWAGESVVKGDLKMQNQNGKMCEHLWQLIPI